MSRYNTVLYNWTEITNRLMKDKQALAQFLRFSAGMYKQSFADAALIYFQNPNATKVATLETWNRLGRVVNRGEHSISVFGEGTTARHLFDITQTNGKRIPDLWKITEDISGDITGVINDKYGKDCKNIQETIAAISVDSIKGRLPDVQYATEQMKLTQEQVTKYQQSLVSAVRFVVSNRCEIEGGMKLSGGINLAAADMFKDTRDLIRFCDIVQRSAKDALLEIEQEIVQIQRRKKEQLHGLQNEPDRSIPVTNGVHAQSEDRRTAEKADRQVGQNVDGVDKEGVSAGSTDIHNGGQVESDPATDRRGSGETVSGARQSVSGAESPSENLPRDPGMGKNARADSRTSGDAGSRISVENVTPDDLIQMNLNADFNRRLDNYEIAGWAFKDSRGTSIEPINYFNRYIADRYSAIQQQEIRDIMEAAIQNEKRLNEPEQQKSEVTGEVPESIDAIPDKEPVIINNTYVDTGLLPPMTDERLINAIISNDRFFKVKKDEIAAFFAENEDMDKRAEFMKNAINTEYCELDVGDVRVGYKSFDNGLNVWEGSYLSRTKESGLSWDLVQSLTAALIEKGEYLDPEKEPVKKASRSSASRAKTDDLVIYSFRMEEAENTVYASCEIGGRKFEAPIERSENGEPYIMDGKKPYKLNDYQTYDLEQFELYRSPIVHDKNGYYAEDLDEGDTVRLEGELWTVEKKTDNMIHLSRETDAGVIDKHIYDNWQEAITQMGFEYIPEKAPAVVVKEPAKNRKETAPESGGEQLSFFGEPVDMAEPPKPKKRERLRLVYPAVNVTPEMVDFALKCAGNEPKSLERIAYQFMKGKSDAENAEFLRKEFGTDGRGYFLSDETQLSAWFDNDGITLGVGVTAFNIVTKEHITWEDAAKRIGEMLANGEYCEQDVIDRAVQNEITDLSEQLWFLHQDLDRESGVQYFIPDDRFEGGFPESHKKIMADLGDPETVKKYIAGLEDFIRKYEENRDIMRFHFHKPKESLYRLRDLLIQRKDFQTKPEFEFKPRFFITEDEKDYLLLARSGLQTKFEIAEFFKNNEDEKSRITKLKHTFGEGGAGRSGYSTWYDAKGYKFVKSDLAFGTTAYNTMMKWNEVSARIDRLITESKYITQKDIDERIKDAKYDLEHYDPNEYTEQYVFQRAKEVLDEYGVDYSDILERKALTAEQEKEEELPRKEETEKDDIQQEKTVSEEPEIFDPVQTAIDAEQKQTAVFMNIEDEGFIYIGKTDTEIEYTMFSPDLVAVDGGVIDRLGTVDLRYEASFILDNGINDLAEIRDKKQFFELTEMEYDGDVPARLAELKADAIANMPDSREEMSAPVEEPEEKAPVTAEIEEEAVFMDTRDESFISLMQVDEGVEYTLYFPDLTPIDGGVWEMDEYMDLQDAAKELLATESSSFVKIPDYDTFMEIADMNTDLDVQFELAKLKAAARVAVSEQNDVPEEAVVEDENNRGVFMDNRDETFIYLERKERGIEYIAYEPNLTPVDGGFWETYGETPDLNAVAAEFMATTVNGLTRIKNTTEFLRISNIDSIEERGAAVERIKMDSMPSIYDTGEKTETKETEIQAPAVADIPETEEKSVAETHEEQTVEAVEEHTPDVAEEQEESAPEAAEEQHIELAAKPEKQEKPAAEAPTVNAPERIMMTPKKEPKAGTPVTYHYHEGSTVKGAKAKFRANVAAIETLRKVEAENRYATPEEQEVMAKYSGWGGIPQAFTTDIAADRAGGALGEAAPDGWAEEQAQLRALLSSDEYAAARESTLTSFYTPPEVTDCVYQALGQFGFEDGNILEPSMGVGNFLSKMPEEMHEHSKVYGVELDSISGRIAQMLYPEDRIQIKGFEQTRFNNNSFDVVIGNIPFGDYRVSDKAYDKLGFKIHDYFAAKSVDKVKPGGVVALVTSKFTMDKANEAARRYLAERCDLLGAVRMPAGTFKDADSITTDILFLKKRETLTVTVPEWVHMGQTEDGIPCNQYFVNNPDMVLGTMEWDERMKGKYGPDSKVTVCTANSDIPLSEQLKAAVEKIKGSIETVRNEEQEQGETINMIPADPSVRNFTHTVVDGKLYFRENEVMIEVQETGKALERMIGMHNIRLAAMAVIDAQAAGCTDEELHELQTELNRVYDRFRKSFGNITDSANERVFRQDDDYNTLAALEIIDTEKKTVEKSEIFTKRTILPEMEILSVETPQEALQVSLDRKGVVDIPYMAGLMSCTPEKMIADLGDQIFRDPAKTNDEEPYSGYVDASEYLSGNVREKLKIARDFAEHIDSGFQRNVSALQKVIPKDLEASEISVRIGANWIDLSDYNKFLREYAGANTSVYGGHPVTRTKTGEYKIEGKGQDRSYNAVQSYGTARMSSYQIFENLLNQRDIVVKDRVEDDDGKVSYVINPEATQLAKEKARQMKEAFKNWIWAEPARREKYVERYNYMFNAIRGREYDGSHQTFPGMNPAIKLRAHQENAVLRAKLGGNTLLAHCVGAGKSFEMIASSMEKKRLGLINKACVVVPKHLTLQTASEWMRLYPNAKLLVARPEDFTKDNRQKFIARCVTGDYDAVIMSFQQFERIPMSDEYCKMFMQKELDTIMDALQDADKSDRTSIKALEKQKKRIEEKLDKLMSSKKDNSLCFEKLGFDYLVCDEAHYYKNCFVATKMSNVAGVQTTAAQKSEDMLMKTQYLNDKYGCNNILFATGTPVSNSMVEFYVMQRYLRPDLLEKAGLETFDDWASTFGEVVSQLEIKPAGNGFQMKNRFSKFVNIPELMQMYKEFADIQTQDMIKLKVPELKTGEPIVVVSKPDQYQKEYMKELARRSERIHSGSVDPREDNMLRITHEARLLGLDSRCMYDNIAPAPDCKVMKLIDNLEQNYYDTMEQKGVQIVFCDIAVNDDDGHFSVYEAIKDELVKRGIPREEICFAGDAQTDKARAEMYEKLRSGEKRFILASTTKLGTGANVQDRICAIHHLDIPWKPSDLTQQDGRGIRQGNSFKEVGIYHYLTENTFDSYMMGIITNKAKFIAQIMTSKDPVRVSEDVDETVLTYSQMQAIASGNPMIKEKIQLDNDIATLRTLETAYKSSLYKTQDMVERKLPVTIENYANLLQKASTDLKQYQERHPESADFSMEIGGTEYSERADAGAEIEKAIIKCLAKNEAVRVGSYCGFELTIEPNSANGTFFGEGSPAVAVLSGNLKYSTEINQNNPLGNIRRIENLTGMQISQRIKKLTTDLEQARTSLESAKTDLAKPFEHAEELEQKLARLAVVNAELSKNKAMDDDEPIPVIDDSIDEEQGIDESRDKAVSQKEPVPVAAKQIADSISTKPYMPPKTNMPKRR